MAHIRPDTFSSLSKQTNHKPGNLVIISGPSGAGKTTLFRAVLERFPQILYSVSHTTRKPRHGERDGVDYYFIPENEFKRKIEEGKWAEWAQVHGHFYGTSADFLYHNVASGYNILLDIDVQGTIQILKHFPNSLTIFILPPSMDVLEKRLISRGYDDKTAIGKRLFNAKKEMEKKDIYRHAVVNDQLSVAMAELISIIEKELLAE